MPVNPLDGCVGFEWDDGNALKNWERHRVTPEEAEEVFFHDPFLLRPDLSHSSKERRYRALGRTVRGRRLMLAFVIRRSLVRVISIRDMNRKESDAYDRLEGDS